jgi:hypothetical protein
VAACLLSTSIVVLAEGIATGIQAPRPVPGAAASRQTEAVAEWPVTFVDVAQQAGLRDEIVYGGLERKRFIIETNGAGVGLVDVDADGWLDVVLLNGTRLQDGARRERSWPRDAAPVNRLYLNRRDGTFRDVTATSGLARTGWASAVCAGDFDGDERLDLFVTYFGDNVLYRNLGGGRFEDVTARAGLPTGGRRWGSGCALVDYDRDGRLDLFVANYLAFDLERAAEPGEGVNCLWKGVPVNCGPKGLPTDTNLLFHNEGGGRFADVSVPSGIAAVTGRYPMTGAATDLDADGWPDIYVASDSTAAVFYRNNRDGTFTDIAVSSGAAFSDQGMAQAGMGLAVGDWDANGVLDLLKTHFADDVPALYRGLGKGLFEDLATTMGLGVRNRFVQWGGGLPDLDNDGWHDLMYVTGNVYPEVERVLPRYPHRSPRIVFRNVRGGRFEDVTERSGPGAVAAHSSRGAAFGDVDNDGDVDVLVMNMNEPPSLLRNDLRGANHWLQVRLRGGAGNLHGLGASVRVTSQGRTQARAVLSQSSYYSVDDLRAHFGLGAATSVERVEVQWPGGRVERFAVSGVDRVVDLREGTGAPVLR